jgi:hypothetical protein
VYLSLVMISKSSANQQKESDMNRRNFLRGIFIIGAVSVLNVGNSNAQIITWYRVNLSIPRCTRSRDGMHKLSPEQTGPAWDVANYPGCKRKPVYAQCSVCKTDITIAYKYNGVPPFCPGQTGPSSSCG